jgi:hypothetical protein
VLVRHRVLGHVWPKRGPNGLGLNHRSNVSHRGNGMIDTSSESYAGWQLDVRPVWSKSYIGMQAMV